MPFTPQDLESLEKLHAELLEITVAPEFEIEIFEAFPRIAEELRRVWRFEQEHQTVYINPSSSTCGNCGRGCDPSEKRHRIEIGYATRPGTLGCQVVWKYVSTQYMGKREMQAAIKMRPDLIPIDVFGSPLNPLT